MSINFPDGVVAEVISNLSNIFHRRVTLDEKCGMLDIKLVGFLHKVKHCRRLAVNKIGLPMFLDILDRFLFETALRPARLALVLFIDRCKLVTLFHLGDKRVDSCELPFQLRKLVRVVIGVFALEKKLASTYSKQLYMFSFDRSFVRTR